MKADRFIIVYCDGDLLNVQFGWDEDCLGAVCAYVDSVALFSTRKLARQAIRISARYAALCAAQGRAVNGDFIEGIKHVKIIPCAASPLAGQ